MRRFSELGENKFSILMKLISKPEIVKCLVNNEPNFLDIPLPEDFEPNSLVYSAIYPYRYIPTIQTEAKTFITMSFSYKPDGSKFKNASVRFYIMCHNSLLKTDYGSLRYDMLLNYIDKTFNQFNELQSSKLQFYDMDDFVVNENYSGIFIIYKSTSFQ